MESGAPHSIGEDLPGQRRVQRGVRAAQPAPAPRVVRRHEAGLAAEAADHRLDKLVRLGKLVGHVAREEPVLLLEGHLVHEHEAREDRGGNLEAAGAEGAQHYLRVLGADALEGEEVL